MFIVTYTIHTSTSVYQLPGYMCFDRKYLSWSIALLGVGMGSFGKYKTTSNVARSIFGNKKTLPPKNPSGDAACLWKKKGRAGIYVATLSYL